MREVNFLKKELKNKEEWRSKEGAQNLEKAGTGGPKGRWDDSDPWFMFKFYIWFRAILDVNVISNEINQKVKRGLAVLNISSSYCITYMQHFAPLSQSKSWSWVFVVQLRCHGIFQQIGTFTRSSFYHFIRLFLKLTDFILQAYFFPEMYSFVYVEHEKLIPLTGIF